MSNFQEGRRTRSGEIGFIERSRREVQKCADVAARIGAALLEFTPVDERFKQT